MESEEICWFCNEYRHEQIPGGKTVWFDLQTGELLFALPELEGLWEQRRFLDYRVCNDCYERIRTENREELDRWLSDLGFKV